VAVSTLEGPSWKQGAIGASAGFGGAIPIGGRARLLAEARYHLIEAPSGTMWFVPLSVGVRF
jgi:hypothetical protein